MPGVEAPIDHHTAGQASVRLRMLLAYNGGGFHGMAVQRRERTVAKVLLEALTTVLRQTTRPALVVAGRTDTGVHAWGQVVHVDVNPPSNGTFDLEKAQRSLNKMLGPEIVVRKIAIAADGFHARYSATYRRYRYTIVNRAVPDPFLAPFAWHVTEPLDRVAMTLGCDPLYGEHDFSSFCRVPKGEPDASMTRVLTEMQWVELDDGLLRFDIGASSFCQQMVRSIVGLLVEIGRGKRSAGEVLAMLRSQDRSRGAPLAPPHGLCLWEVGYPDTFVPYVRNEANAARSRRVHQGVSE